MKRFFQILIIILVLLLSACTTEDIYIDDAEDNEPLKIYILQDIDHGFENYIWKYNTSKPEDKREIEITKFKYGDEKEMYTQITNEMSLGGGPDIIAINYLTDKHFDINKLSQSNAFANIDILIENSETFDFDNYNKMVLDAGILNGKRVFVPTTFGVKYLLGVEETFDFYNMEKSNQMTMDTFIDLLENYYQTTDNEAILFEDPVYLLSEFITVGDTIEKSEQLERLFSLLKVENNRYIQPRIKKIYTNDSSFFDEFDPLLNKDYLIAVPQIYGYNQYRVIYDIYNYMNYSSASHMLWLQQPITENSAIKAYTESGLAININSKHKNEAFEFVQFVLSHHIQSDRLRLYELPVNKETYNNEAENLVEGGGNSFLVLPDVEEIPLPEQIRNDFIEYVESAQTCEYIGTFRYVYYNIMQESIEDYYNDKLTFDELIDELNNKLFIYYTE